MNEKIIIFLDAARDLLAYMDEEHVYDKLGDAGCGGVDPYQSEKLFELIEKARKALNEIDNGGASP